MIRLGLRRVHVFQSQQQVSLGSHLQPCCAADALPQRRVAHELLRQSDRRLVIAWRVQEPCDWYRMLKKHH